MPTVRTDPPVSEAQRRAMWAAKSGNSNLGIPRKVGAEFAAADPGGRLPARRDAMRARRDGGDYSGAPEGAAGVGGQAASEVGTPGGDIAQMNTSELPSTSTYDSADDDHDENIRRQLEAITAACDDCEERLDAFEESKHPRDAGGRFGKGTHVKVNAPGLRGHGSSGHVVNDPARHPAGMHFVSAPAGEYTNYGPFHGHQLRATGKPAKVEGGPRRMDPVDREMERSGVKPGSRESKRIRALLQGRY